MKKSLYIVTKPIQYINASNIIDYNSKDLIIVSWFDNSLSFYNFIRKKSAIWNNVLYFRSRNNSLIYVLKRKQKYNKIFIDSDFGIFTNLIFLLLYPIPIYVYEEGWATYFKISCKKSYLNPFKFFLNTLFFHSQTYFGGSYFTKSIYTYYPLIMKKNIPEIIKPIIPFKSTFLSHINNLKDLAFYTREIDNSIITNKQCILFLASWPNFKIDKYIHLKEVYKDYVSIIKLHPHMIKYEIKPNLFDMTIDKDIPIEIFIAKALPLMKKLIIVHENSSVAMYFRSSKIDYINISNFPISYTNFNLL